MKFFTVFLALYFAFPSTIVAQNNALLFDGVDDKVIVQGTQSPFNLSTFTLEAWVFANNWKAQQWQGTIIAKDQGNQTGFTLRCGNNGRLSFNIGNGSGWPEIVSGPIMQTNKWHHVAAVYDNGNMTLYIDGNLEASATGNAISNSTVNLHIGESSGFTGRVFDGRIDEVRIWNIARTQAEIDANDTVNIPTSTAGLLAYYKFDQINGTTLPNLTATANLDGTLINFPSNPWVSGFEPTTTDMSVEAIISPNQISFFEGAFRIRSRFKNNGINTINGFEAYYELNGQVFGPELIQNIVLPGAVLDYTFEGIASADDSISSLKVFSDVLGDQNALNDTIQMGFIKPSPWNLLTIPIFSNKQHNFAAAGQSHIARIPLPENNIKYSQIIMNIAVSCPSSGCDPWDQPAKISLLKNGQTYELARFITPYGKGCGPWTVDVTDFKPLLQGSCDFSSYIQVWGASGWLLNVSLTFVEGNVPNPYHVIDKLWSTDNWVYGDPNISYDLPAKTIAIKQATNATDLRMTVTGHGQANTDNAAEFSQKTHRVMANGSMVTNHFVWKANCAQNSCSNQFGTWQFNRAGWCPGESVEPFMVNLSNQALPGQNLDLDYELQTYTNFLNTGYNGGSHTEPHYKIHGYLIQKSDTYFDSLPWTNLAAERISNVITSTGEVRVIIRNYGSVDIIDPPLKLYLDGQLVATEFGSGIISSGDSLEHTFNTQLSLTPGVTHQVSASVEFNGDQAASDDVASTSVFLLSGILANETRRDVKLFPNPNHGTFSIEGKGISTIRILSTTGKILLEKTIEKNAGLLHLNLDLPSGVYIFNATGEDLNHNEVVIID